MSEDTDETLEARLVDACRERDAAGMCDICLDKGTTLTGEPCVCEGDGLSGVATALRLALHKMERERDEARAEAAVFYGMLEVMGHPRPPREQYPAVARYLAAMEVARASVRAADAQEAYAPHELDENPPAELEREMVDAVDARVEALARFRSLEPGGGEPGGMRTKARAALQRMEGPGDPVDKWAAKLARDVAEGEPGGGDG